MATTSPIHALPSSDPIFDMSRWMWPYGPFALTDPSCNRWELSAVDPWGTGTTATLTCRATAEIDGVPYAIVGQVLLRADGTPIAAPERTQIFPPPAESPNPSRVMHRSLELVRAALSSPEAPAAFRRAIAIAQLPPAARVKVVEQTWLAFATQEAIEKRIMQLKDDLRPHGGEDSATANLIAELASIRVNSPRKRRKVERLAEELHNRTTYRRQKEERLLGYEARLAELKHLGRQTASTADR